MSNYDDMTWSEMMEEAERLSYGSQAMLDQCNAAVTSAERYFERAEKSRRNAMYSMIATTIELAIIVAIVVVWR